jgi:hypothetical protein
MVQSMTGPNGKRKHRAPSERFTKDSVSKWEVHFERQPSPEEQEQTTLAIEVEELSPLEGRLVGHGVTRSQARKLVSEYDGPRIEVQLEALEFLLVRGGESAPISRRGWLVKAIMENYTAPRGFKSSAQLTEENRQKAQKAKERQEVARRIKAEEEEQRALDSADREKDQGRIRGYLESLTQEERLEIEIAAIRASPIA